MDFRTQDTDYQYAKTVLNSNPDCIILPAPAKQLLDVVDMRDTILNWIERVSIGLHHVSKVLIIEHWDCGAHGGSGACASPELELELHRDYLRRACQLLAGQFPQLQVLAAYSVFDGEIVNYFSFDWAA